MEDSHLKKEKYVGSHGIYASLCNVQSLEVFLDEVSDLDSPIVQVNHFVSSHKPSAYCVFYDGPVWITELVPDSYDLLEVTMHSFPRDPRVKTGTYTAKDPGTLQWTPIKKMWYPVGSVFRLCAQTVPKALVVHKKTNVPCDLLDFARGYPSWTHTQLDTFVPKCPREENRSPVELPDRVRAALLGTESNPAESIPRESNSRESRTEDIQSLPTPRISQYTFARAYSLETLLKWI